MFMIAKRSEGFSHHFVLPLLAIIAVGAIGAWLTFGSKAATSGPQPKRGLVDDGAYAKREAGKVSEARNYLVNGDKNKYAFAITQGGMRHTVLNVGVRELVNVSDDGSTEYKSGSIETRIKNITDWNKRNPTKKLTVHLRFHVGEFAPAKWKELCGTVLMKDKSFGVEADAPRWWAKDGKGNYIYRPLYANAMKALAHGVDVVNNDPETRNIIGSVNAPGAAPNYPEPMIIYSGSDPVRRALISKGFKATEHNDFMTWFPKQAKYFNNVAVELAINPYQNIDEENGKVLGRDAQLYKAVAQSLVDEVGSRTVLANYSAREAYFRPGAKGEYVEMYKWMISMTQKAPKVWAGVQMARPHRVAMGNADINEKWDDVAMWVADKGFSFAETTGPRAAKKAPFGNANYLPDSYKSSADIDKIKRINANFLNNSHP
jgi:hypothetical protein